MASGRNGTLYVGVTSELPTRVVQPKQKTFKGFTSAYGCSRSVWYERHTDMVDAIRGERAIKRWLREWKLRLIEDLSPDWRDLSEGWYD